MVRQRPIYRFTSLFPSHGWMRPTLRFSLCTPTPPPPAPPHNAGRYQILSFQFIFGQNLLFLQCYSAWNSKMPKTRWFVRRPLTTIGRDSRHNVCHAIQNSQEYHSRIIPIFNHHTPPLLELSEHRGVLPFCLWSKMAYQNATKTREFSKYPKKNTYTTYSSHF